jgi:hypothetical protein
MGVFASRSRFSVDRLARKSKTDILYEHDMVSQSLRRDPLAGDERKAFKEKTNYQMAQVVADLMKLLPEPPARLVVKDRHDRDDGRFYIPLTQSGTIVARVPSDAFDGDEAEAVKFAESLRDAYNLMVAG